MLRPSGEIRVFGIRYRTIFVCLSVAAVLLAALLRFNIPPAETAAAHGPVFAEILRQLRADWTRVLMIVVLLAITATAGILATYSYFATKDKLARVQGTAKAILESLAGGVLTLDADGRLTVINRAASDILELKVEPPFLDLETIAATHPELGDVIRKALGGQQYVQDHDSVFVNSRNARIILRTTISEQRDETGRRVGVIVLVKDVSTLVAMEEELRKRDRLAAAGTLAAGVAHEIRNPLSALELNLRLLRDEIADALPSHEDAAEYLEILFAETRRLNRITTNFLRLSRGGSVAKTPICLEEPVRRVVHLLDTEAREKGISFDLDLAPNLLVLGDATEIEQVCLNLLINAMQATPSGGVIRISIRSVQSSPDGQVDLIFTDPGTGIPPENLPRIFDPYFTTRSGGTGLGLPIADRIVADHGGKIRVESVSARGTKVTVSLPLAVVTATGGGPGLRT